MKKNCFLLMVLICMICSFHVYGENQQKTFTVGYLTSVGPVQYMDHQQDEQGISIDILKQIGEQMHLSFEFVPILDYTNEEMLNELDIIAAFSYISNLELENYSLNRKSLSYYTAPLLLTGIRDFSSATNMTVGVFDYFNATQEKIHHLIPNATIQHFDDLYKLEKALIDGDVNFIFSTTVTSQAILRADTNKKFQSYPLSLEVPIQLLFSDLMLEEDIRTINKGIDSLSLITRNQIILKNSYDYSLDDTFIHQNDLYDYNYVMKNIMIAVISIIVLSIFVFLMYKIYTEKVTFYDSLTGFYTEYKFNIELEKMLAKAKPNQYILVSVDIDNFKYINEMYQFATGNEVLKRFSEHLKNVYPDGKLFARIHSDNFLILLEHNDVEVLQTVKPFDSMTLNDILGKLYYIYTSTGLYTIVDTSKHITTMLSCVNLARDTGKVTHGNTIMIFSEQMEKLRKTQNKIVTSMEKALEDKEFEVYYQPKVDLKKNATCGAEALIRWIVRDGSAPIYPDEFIPLFEKNRYITKLDFYVFEEVCLFISEHKEELKDVVISVNLSTVTLLLEGLCEELMGFLKQYDLDVHCIELEITESAFVDNLDFVIQQVKTLKDAGFSMALDDFGSGISSLNQLKNIDLDVIKLDKGFLSDSLDGNKGIIVVENVVALAKDLGLKIVAEGVETKTDCDILYDLDCDIVQGYYFARPMPMQDFREFLQKKDFS